MNLERYDHIIALAEEKNFSRAASRAYISQPALSRSIQTLEQELGTVLVIRDRKNARLTPAGEVVLNYARQMTELRENYEKLRNRLDQKDAKIQELRDTLQAERTTRRIELQEAGSIAEAALRLNGIFEIAQKAADQYLENVRRLGGRETSAEEAGEVREREQESHETGKRAQIEQAKG